MLRLRPSELTLTPDDVEETFRRIALRQATRPQSSLPRRPLGQPGRPILRRGPQRATRDALTALGKIPFLQPQQAFVTSVDEDGETPSAREDISSSDPTLDQERQDGPVPLPASSASHTVQLPIRARRESSTQAPVNDTLSNVPCTPQRQISTSPTSGSADMSGGYALSATDSTPGLRGGGSGKPSGDPSKSADHPPGTIFLQGYVESTPTGDVYNFRQYWESEPRRRSVREVPAIRSRSAGYLDNSFAPEPPMGSFVTNPYRTSGPTNYSVFEHVFGTQPQQPTVLTSRNPYFPVPGLGHVDANPSRTSEPTGYRPYNDFSTQPQQATIVASPNPFGHETYTAYPESRHEGRPIPPDSRFPNTIQTSAASSSPSWTPAAGRLGSETSATSAAYSYYGSLPPESRYASFESPASYAMPYSHVDGTEVANESIRSSFRAQLSRQTNIHAPWASGPTTSTSPFSSPYLTHGPSPLPASPYTRTQHRDPSPGQPFVRNTRGFIDAATAASRDLPSPLDPMADQYQRRMHAATNRRTQDVRAITPSSRPQSSQAHRSSQSRNPSHNPYQPHQARIPGFRQLQRSLMEPEISPFPGQRLPVSPYAMPPHSSATAQPRSANVSSENAPAHQSRAPRTNTVQEHRAAYERLQAANRITPAYTDGSRSTGIPPFRHSMPQPSVFDGRSNRPRSNALQNPTTADQPHQRTEERPYSQASTYNRQRQPPEQIQPLNANAAGLAPYFTIPQSHRHHGSEPPPRPPTRAYRPGPGATHLQPTRDAPLTALAPDQGTGTTSRRTRSPVFRGTTTARTHRRVPPEQRDQENDGERAMMRREEGNINARYAEDGQLMNETPPRTGPVERRLHE